MNKLDHEQISALIDGYWSDDQGRTDTDSAVAALDSNLDALLADEQARARWTRYHLIRDALQESPGSPLDAGFADRVSAAIQAEPAIVALPSSERETNRRQIADQSADQSAVSQETEDASSGAGSNVVQGNFKRNLVGLSVAATVAMVSLVGLNVLQGSRDAVPGNTNTVAVLPSTDTPVLPNQSGSVNGEIQFVSNPVGSYWVSQERALSPESEQRL
ncbi:MAG: sigma-E factor negative regulatory protein, partial [Gammaproteobacteria bacterium]|nr:sigma-E factor negative regulatory protein [Gammaproteobacteria bacterium]